MFKEMKCIAKCIVCISALEIVEKVGKILGKLNDLEKFFYILFGVFGKMRETFF